jgi:transposase-like protein
MKSNAPRDDALIASPDEGDASDVEAIPYNDKMKIECLCPKCGRKHVMSFHWIGRGTPRKYCQSCKGSYVD